MRRIRLTCEADADAVMEMYDHSRKLMRAAGNTTQWTGYPTLDSLHSDIRRGVSYIIEDEQSQPVGTFALIPGEEPTYNVIVRGRWIDNMSPYATLHRLACAPNQHGIASEVFAFAKERFSHLRADTHESNTIMQHIMMQESFVYCGIVFMSDNSERLAYEWWRYDCVPHDLTDYIENTILPLHNQYDAAHRRDHVCRVIARSMAMFPSAMTYTAAAMHDIGICEGREIHHLASGRIIRSNVTLQQWFTGEQIETIAQAAEDHRASASTPPRSKLGCIIAEADRDIEPETIVRRTVEYGLSHYPELDREGHWQRTLQHLNEKYSEHGYIKLWLPNSPNKAPLSELRNLINDTVRLRLLFEKYYN